MKNIAIVGLGKWGKILLNEFQKTTNVSICVTKGNEKNISWLQMNYPNIKHSTNFNEILLDNSIDAVVIATPISTHYDLIRDALNHKKHVFTEKPLSETTSNAKNLQSLAKTNKVCLFVGHIFIYHPILEKIKKLIKNDKVYHISMNWNKFGSFKENTFLNLVSHDISILLELLGTPKKLSKISSENIISKNDLILLKADYSKTCSGFITINRVSNHNDKSILIVSKNHYLLWQDYNLYELNKKTRKFKKIFHSNKTSLSIEINEFLKNMKTGTSNSHNLQISIDTLKLISKLMN